MKMFPQNIIKLSHSFELKAPYTIEEINKLLTKYVFEKSIYSPSISMWTFVDEKPFIGTYNNRGFNLIVNPQKKSGFTTNYDSPGIINGEYKSFNDFTLIQVNIRLPLFTKLFLFIITAIVFFVSFACLFNNLIIGMTIMTILLVMYIIISKLTKYSSQKVEALFKEILK